MKRKRERVCVCDGLIGRGGELRFLLKKILSFGFPYTLLNEI